MVRGWGHAIRLLSPSTISQFPPELTENKQMCGTTKTTQIHVQQENLTASFYHYDFLHVMRLKKLHVCVCAFYTSSMYIQSMYNIYVLALCLQPHQKQLVLDYNSMNGWGNVTCIRDEYIRDTVTWIVWAPQLHLRAAENIKKIRNELFFISGEFVDCQRHRR